ncbi:DUF3667 domain-containing protein [Maribacter sp. HTCC2170]|uniref:DUF3667 domain-containing protein n=1 Tax=Maribacter sp. (strain HTCC2170 / KCCM 42371) TaxID=313603 RepID=UPI00006ADA3C|nr:DUF3667 domain-containing protein [Maribacter sp. HTCC2170]EAQ99820.1 hypothetical protein FB2170_15901 [Maribacter sp. HTCC2170]
MSTTEKCKNCEKSFDVSFDYCPFCGQETADNLTFGVLFSNTISNYFSIDARFLKSFIPLMLKPGVLARRFVDGKRLSYLHPAQFYLFISVIFFFIFSFNVRKADNEVTMALKKGFDKDLTIDSLQLNKDSLNLELAKDAIKNNGVIAGISDEDFIKMDSTFIAEQKASNESFIKKRKALDSLIAIDASMASKLKAIGIDDDESAITHKFFEQMLKFYEQKGEGILNTLYDIIPIAMFFMLPLFAFLLKLFYWGRGTFAHHMVFSFYFFTYLFTSFCLLILVNLIIEIPLWIEVIFFFSFIFYLILALHNFYKSGWVGAFFKANAISFLYIIFIVPIAISGIIMVSFMLY